MPEIEEPLRPTAVTVIGWLWLVAAALFLFRALINMVVWAGVAAFGSFWFWLWRRIAAAPRPSVRPLGSIGLVVVLAVCLAAAAGLALMIASLRSSRVRAAFRHPPEPTTRNAG